MTKKFFATLVLTFALVIAGGQASTAEAREVYVGTYDDGRAVYLLTETIQKHSAPFDCTCTVRAGSNYLDYSFGWDSDVLYYKNSEGYHGRVFDGNSPVAREIYRYIRGR